MLPVEWEILETSVPVHVEDVLRVLLRNRGGDSSFFTSTLKDLESSLAMRGMADGAQLMARHLFNSSKLVLVGDYDCDGLTALAQMGLFLKDIGYRNCVEIIPSRSEGYGIPRRAISQHPDAGLLVAMDCGTNEHHAIAAAREQGMDTLVIDHHEVSPEGAAPIGALINPKHPQCPSTFKEFSSAGLTLLFLATLRRCLDGVFPRTNLGGKYLALAAVGTVADMTPLIDSNRILVRQGLSAINKGDSIALNQLARAAGLSRKSITAGDISYYLGPRINAAGRMGDAPAAFKFLVSERHEELESFAQQLNRYNAMRQQEENSVLAEVRRRCAFRPAGERTLVVADRAWSPGIVGIVGSRVVREIHHGPAVILSVDEKRGIARGSARSVPGFDMHGALEKCSDLLLQWGGHKMAAGLTVSLECLQSFSRRLEDVARRYPPEIFLPKGKVDVELKLDLVSWDLWDGLMRLEPFGVGNPRPLFAGRQVPVSIAGAFGKEGKHLRLVLGEQTDAVFWGGAAHRVKEGWRDGGCLDVVFHVDWDNFKGKPAVFIKDAGKLF